MNYKRLAVFSLSAVISLGSFICSLVSFDASANTLTDTDAPLDVWGYLDDDSVALYNPFGPFRFNYYSEYSNMVYGVDIPDTYGGAPTQWETRSDYSVFSSLGYLNNLGIFAVDVNDLQSIEGVPCFNFQMNSDLFWLDSFQDWYIMSDAPCNVSLFVWYDNAGVERTYTAYNQDYAEWEFSDNAYSLDVYEMLAGFSDAVEAEYGFLGDDGSATVRTFTITFTPVSEWSQLVTLPLYDVDDEPITLTSYYAYKHMYLGASSLPEVVPDDFFGWIFDAVSSFLDTEFLPDVSFGKLMLIALGFVVFGLGIKIAFGG